MAARFPTLGPGDKVRDKHLPDRLSEEALDGSYAPTSLADSVAVKVDKWQPEKAYAAGAVVVNPFGDLVSAKVTFITGTVYNAGNWNLSSSYTKPAELTAIAPTGGARAVGKGELYFNVRDFGAKGDGVTDDTVSIQAALDAAATAGGAKVVLPAGDYRANNLTVGDYVVLQGIGGSFSRFGPSLTPGFGIRKAAVRIYRLSGTTTDPVIRLLGAGSGLCNVHIEGAGAPGTILVTEGFESTVDEVRVINGGGIGIDVQKCNNNRWRNVYVDNCGSVTLPGMKVWSKTGAGGANETNSFDIYGLTIERCVNVALDIAYNPANLADQEYWAEFVRIHNLHIESSSANQGAGANVGNTDALVRIGNIRSLHLTTPFIYGGPGYLIEHNQQFQRSYGNGGIKIDGGTLLGSDTATGVAATPALVHLINGDDFSMELSRIFRATTNDLVIESTYGNAVTLAPTVYPSVRISDARAAKTLNRMKGNHQFEGQLRTTGTAPTLGGSASINAAFIAGSTDTAGKIKFGTGTVPAAGVLFSLTFSKAYAKEPTVIVSPGNPLTAALVITATSTLNGIIIRCTNAPAASQASTTFEVNYLVIGND